MRRSLCAAGLWLLGCSAATTSPAPGGLGGAGPIDSEGGEPRWARAEWSKLEESPCARSGHSMAYDERAERVVVLAGHDGRGPVGDFWAWDGQRWSRLPSPPGAASERDRGAIAWDARAGRLIIHQGLWSDWRDGQLRGERLSAAWAWDGARWSALTVPAGAGLQAMADDTVRGRLLPVGGMAGETLLGDTWELDGSSFKQPPLVEVPPPRLNHRMAFDSARGRVVLFGGQQVGADGQAINLDDTWEWDGQRWERRPSPVSPPGRGFHAMAFDEVRGRTLLAGGTTFFPGGSVGGVLLDDFWEWDGVTWRPLSPAGAHPVKRSGAAMAFDRRRERVVLFGGQGAEGELEDVWEWDGARWEEKTPVLPGRSNGAVAARRGALGAEAVVFGGLVSAGGFALSDAWRLEEGRWRRVPAPGPGPRALAKAAFHGDEVLLFGGSLRSGGSVVYLGDTWVLSPANEWRREDGAGPSARSAHAMAHDPSRGRTVLFGGFDGAALQDTWEWDGRGWTRVPVELSPPARRDHALRYDAALGELVLAGGIDAARALLNDAWSFNGVRWRRLDRAGAPTARFRPASGGTAWGTWLSFGGESGRQVLSDLWVHQGSWRELASTTGPGPRFQATLVEDGDGFLLFGGSDSDFTARWFDHRDVWRLRLVAEQ